jgi:nickel-dependent lactate racemase
MTTDHRAPGASAPRILERTLRTAAWCGEQALDLHFPAEWDLTVFWPRTPPPLTDAGIVERLEHPSGQPPIAELCRGKAHPLVIVDDLNRPTPVARVMPFVLEQFQRAGLALRDVRILVATGTHGAPRMDSVRRKVGPEAASQCRVLLHDARGDLVTAGRTSFGTPVIVNKEVMSSDFVMGVGGVYPNHTAGFGGGSKLALGVLGFRSIMHLHFGHRSMRWGRSDPGNSFRRDLNEIARMIRLDTIVSLQINADREVIRVTCGDHYLYYDDEVAFCRRVFSAPAPAGADAVISNAYPRDSSFTVVHQKGITPLQQCGPGTSRIVIASCTEGAGHHGLTPVLNRPRLYRARQIARRIAMMTPRELAGAVSARLRRGPDTTRTEPKNPIWLYRPGDHPDDLPARIPGFRRTGSWPEILQRVDAEQGGRKRLKVLLYPCAPLQCLEGREESSDR